jgi:Rrf2 family protein
MGKIINISDAASIAIHSLAIIAASKKHINVQQIAGITGFSKNHLAKIMQRLVKNNYIKSVRGPKGGFVLACDSKKISLLEIFELIEGNVEDNCCTTHTDQCIFINCVFGGMTGKLSAEFKNYLQRTSIHQVATIK